MLKLVYKFVNLSKLKSSKHVRKSERLKNSCLNLLYIIIIIMNFTADQSCDHAVSMSSKHARKSERSKNSCLNLLYTYCSLSVICSNYLASVVSTSLDLSSLNSC